MSATHYALIVGGFFTLCAIGVVGVIRAENRAAREPWPMLDDWEREVEQAIALTESTPIYDQTHTAHPWLAQELEVAQFRTELDKWNNR